MRPRLSPEDQDLGSSATLYCYREQSGGGGSTEVLPSADVPEGEKPLKAKAKARKVGQLNLREEDVVMKTVNELTTDVRLPDGFTRGNNQLDRRAQRHRRDREVAPPRVEVLPHAGPARR